MAVAARPALLGISAAADLIASGRLSPVELVRDVLDLIARLEPHVSAYATLLPDQALDAARRAEYEISRGIYQGPLHGIPIALKDLIDTAGVPTTWGSAVHAERVPSRDAEAWRRLRQQGAILIGKSVTHEMGCGTRCPPTSNPWDLERGPGGSSGGSAAALAAGLCLGALGTDTGGSVRIPAACTGTVGFKPTFGLVPTSGVMVCSWSLDHVGPMARTVDDVAHLFRALTGAPIHLPDAITGHRLGVATGWFREHVQPGVLAAFDTALQVFADSGAHVIEVNADFLAGAAALGSLIALPELASLHYQDLQNAHLLGDQVRHNLELGLAEPAPTYIVALRSQQAIQRQVRALFETHALDALLTPTLPMAAARKDQPTVDFGDGYVESTEAAYVRFCVGFNLTGAPALSVPCGRDTFGLPVGLQIVGRPYSDATVLAIGRAFQGVTEHHRALPPIVSRTAAGIPPPIIRTRP
jgi:aspartyl-tRNA(Asn)/glutamyl-tRNA(Gln) amidotransferase subunit A